MRKFALTGKLGVDSTLSGDLRGRNANGGGKPVLYVESNDAGSLFRLSDTYPRMTSGQMWIAMDPPPFDHAPQEGVLNVRDFTIRGEAALDTVVAGTPRSLPNGVEFSRMRVEFTRQTGRTILRDGVVVVRSSARRSTDFWITPTTTCGCAGLSFRFTASTTRSGKFQSSACFSAATRKVSLESRSKWSDSPENRCCGSIRSRLSHRDYCGSSSNSATPKWNACRI